MTSIIRSSARLAGVAYWPTASDSWPLEIPTTAANIEAVTERWERNDEPDREYLCAGDLVREAARWLGDGYDVVVVRSAEDDDHAHCLRGRARLAIPRNNLLVAIDRGCDLAAQGALTIADVVNSTDDAMTGGRAYDSITAIARKQIWGRVIRLYFVRVGKTATTTYIDFDV